jgi:glucose/arabinose dehydrogenase
LRVAHLRTRNYWSLADAATRATLSRAGHDGRMNRRRLAILPAALTALLLSGCSGGSDASRGERDSTGDSKGTTTPITDIATGLEAPWSMVRTTDGSILISQRDDGTVVEVEADGSKRDVGVIEGVVHEGEGGLLGLALDPADPDRLYAYETTATDNRIVRVALTGAAGSYGLSSQVTILDGLAKASNHDGGRIAFGPDGLLYVTVGDAGDPTAAQDRDSLNGKILRMTPDGDVPPGNPFDDSLVWSMGHRNPQGIAWSDDGRMWASEFGQNEFDELNLIEAGNNYGWPEVEGTGGGDGYTDPKVTWTTDEASPSGLAAIGDHLYLAGLGGERLWTITPGDDFSVTSSLEGELGRLRDVSEGSDGSLWILTSNTDGRGAPADSDDRLVSVPLPGR